MGWCARHSAAPPQCRTCSTPTCTTTAGSSGTKPWSFPEVEPIIRKYLELRMRLLPYFYSAFARYHFDGTPPFRAMALDEGFTSELKKDAGSASLEENPYAEAVSKEI